MSSRLRHVVSPLIGAVVLLAICFGLGVSGQRLLEGFQSFDLGLALLLPGLALLQTWVLSERWRVWEIRSGEQICAKRALDYTVSSTVVALAWGPLAGDLVRGVGRKAVVRSRWRGILADRVVNTALALWLATLCYAPWFVSGPVSFFCAILGVKTLGPQGARAAALTLIVFLAIGLQVNLALWAFHLPLSTEQVALVMPALLVVSLVPVSFLGLTGKEIGLAWFLPLTPEQAVSVAALLATSALIGPSLWWLIRPTLSFRRHFTQHIHASSPKP